MAIATSVAADGIVDVRVEMLPSQIEMLGWTAKWAASRGGVGSGKSVAWAWWLLQRMEEYPESTFIVAGADYPQLRGGFFQTFRNVLESLGYVEGKDFYFRENPTPFVRLLWSGARVRSISAKLAQRIRSLEVQTLVVEEPQTWYDGQTVFGVLAGRLRHSEGSARRYPTMQTQGRVSYNPPPKGSWIYEMVEKAWKRQGYPSMQLSLRDNHLLLDRDEVIQTLEATLPASRVRVDVDGEYGQNELTVYQDFDADLNTKVLPGMKPLEYDDADETRPLLWSWDFNFGLMCSIIGQLHRIPKRQVGWNNTVRGRPPEPVYERLVPGVQPTCIYLLDELRLPGVGVQAVVDAFLNLHGERARRVGVILYGDGSGGNRSHLAESQGPESPWEMVVKLLLKAGIRLDAYIQKHNPPVGNRTMSTNAQCHTLGEGRGLFAHPTRCPFSIKDLELVQVKPGTNEIDKRKDPSLTHLCLARGTLVSTERGDVAIEDVRVGDHVWTRAGLRTVTASELTKRNAQTMQVAFSNGATLDLTPTHPVYVKRCNRFVAASELQSGDECITISKCIPLFSRDGRTRDRRVGDTGKRDGATRRGHSTSIATFGKAFTGRFRRAGTSIILTAIRRTMRSTTSNVCRAPSTSPSIVKSALSGVTGSSGTAISPECASWQNNGTRALRALLGIVNTAGACGYREPRKVEHANSVASRTKRAPGQLGSDIAGETAKRRLGVNPEPIMSSGCAQVADNRSSAVGTCQPETAVAHVLHVSDNAKPTDVFDLTVEGEHEFFANSILVSNSDAIGYLCWMVRIMTARAQMPELHSFMGR